MEKVIQDYQLIAEQIEQLRNEDSSDLPEEIENIIQEATDFRGQNIYLRNQLAASDGGFGPPPCWLDSNTGRTQIVFNAVMNENDISVIIGWPITRQNEALENQKHFSCSGNLQNGFQNFFLQQIPYLENL